MSYIFPKAGVGAVQHGLNGRRPLVGAQQAHFRVCQALILITEPDRLTAQEGVRLGAQPQLPGRFRTFSGAILEATRV